MSQSLQHLADLMEKPVDILIKWMFRGSLLVLALMSLPIALDIIGRVAFHKPLPGVIEVEELIMVLLLFLCLPFTERNNTHISIDFLTRNRPQWVKDSLGVAFSIMITGFLLITGYWSIRQGILKATNYTPELHITIWPFLYFIALSMFVTAYISLCKLIRYVGSLLEQKKAIWILIAAIIGLVIITAPFWYGSTGVRFSRFTLGAGGWIFMLILLFVSLPLAYAMGIAGMIGLAMLNRNITAGLMVVGIAPYNAMLSFVMVAVPLFVLMGEITSKSGISRDLFEAAAVWLGRLPGGLAVASVAGCAGFAAICGESLPTAVTMSSVALPEMQRLKYDDSLACGGLAAGGTLGILIPPSIGFIFYSVVTEQSVGMLFMAGIVPGLVLTALFIGVIVITALRYPEKAPSLGKTTWAEKLGALKKVIGFGIIFTVIIVGIMGGFMNPTEASAFGAIGALVVAIASGRFSFHLFVESLEETMKIASRLLFIMVGVGILGYFLAQTRLPTNLGQMIGGMDVNRYVVLMLIIGIWVALGCVMNVIPMILLTLPAIFPTVEMLGFDPIWFGVMAVVVMEMGQLTPPVGIVCFAVSSVGGVALEKVFRGIIPFFLCMWVVVFLLMLFPGLATWLPNLLAP